MATEWAPYEAHKQKVRNIAVQSLVDMLSGGEATLIKAIKQRQAVQNALRFFRPASAAAKDLKAARNLLLKQAHPDVAGAAGTKATQEIGRHWDILKENLDYLR